MKLRLRLFIAAVFVFPTWAVTKEECINFITNWDVAIEMLFNAINPKKRSVCSDSFLDRKGGIAVYRCPDSEYPQESVVEWWNTSAMIAKVKYLDTYPFDIYITKWPYYAARHPKVLLDNPTKELFCQKMVHEKYKPLHFCCLVDSPEKKRKLYSEALMSGAGFLAIPTSGL